MQPYVIVIIPHWNGLNNLVTCLESLYKIDYSNFRVVVVDNNSDDGSPAAIEQRFAFVHLIRNAQNLGFAEGCNVGIGHALRAGADYVWLLNNDAVVEEQALKHLVRAAESQIRVGMTGSKIYYYDRPDTIWGAGMEIRWMQGETIPIGWNQREMGQFDNCRDVEGLAGCSLLVKRTLCEEVGLMDKDYFLYAEEIDWCVRARQRGFRCVFVPQSIVSHKGGASSGTKYRTIFSYYNTRNMLRTISKNFHCPQKQLYLCTAIVSKLWRIRRDLVKAVLVRVLGRKTYRFDVSAFLGVIDFLSNKGGAKNQREIMSFQNWDTNVKADGRAGECFQARRGAEAPEDQSR